MDVTVRRVIRTDRWLCPHCDQLLSAKTFKAHKRRYFDRSSSSWLTKQSLERAKDVWKDHARSALEQDNSRSSHESNEEDPPEPLPLPMTSGFHTAMEESPFNLSDFCLPLDTDSRSGNDSGDISVSADGNVSSGITMHIHVQQ